jgi:hypothetical protein
MDKMSDGYARGPGEQVDPTKGRLLCQEPEEGVRRRQFWMYIFGSSFVGFFFLVTTWSLISNEPMMIVISLWIGAPGVFVIVWARFLMPISLYENGIEYGNKAPPILSDNVVFLSWGELGTFREHEISYFFADSVESKHVYIRKSWPGAKEAVDKIRDRIRIVDNKL